MKRSVTRNFYFLIVAAVVLVLAISAYIFTRYLERQSGLRSDVSTFVSHPDTTTMLRPTQTKVQATEVKLTDKPGADEIMQLLVASINDESVAERNFLALEPHQHTDLSLEDYILYANLLRSIIGRSVDSYSTMTYSERRTVTQEMVEHDPELKSFLNKAGFYWLEYQNEGRLMKFPVLLSNDEKNRSALSGEWVRPCLELRNFATLYFSAIKEKNVEALSRLSYSYPVSEQRNKQKASLLFDFYTRNIDMSVIAAENIISLRMDSIVFRLPQVTTVDTATNTKGSHESDQASSSEAVTELGTSVATAEIMSGESFNPSNTLSEQLAGNNRQQYHTVNIFRRNGTYIPQDVLLTTDYSWLESAPISVGRIALEPGASYTLSTLTEALGLPHRQSRFFMSSGQEEKTTYFHLTFTDVDLVLSQGKDERYYLQSISLLNEKFGLQNGFKVGLKIEDVLQRYLFLDVLGYSYTDLQGNWVRIDQNDKNIVDRVDWLSGAYQSVMMLQDKSEEMATKLIDVSETSQSTGSSQSGSIER